MKDWGNLSKKERREFLRNVSDSEKEKLLMALAKTLIRYEKKKKDLDELMKI